LADSERDQLRVAQPRRTARTTPRFEEIIDLDIECDGEGVEGGEHAASLVDVAIATPTSALSTTAPSLIGPKFAHRRQHVP
jgi:hypothetical protein